MLICLTFNVVAALRAPGQSDPKNDKSAEDCKQDDERVVIFPCQEWVNWSAAFQRRVVIDRCINKAEKQKEDPMELIQVEVYRLECQPQ